MKPILLRRSFGAASLEPQFVSQRSNFFMAKSGNPMLLMCAVGRHALRVQVDLAGVFQRLPRLLMPRLMLLFTAMLLGRPVSMRCLIVQFGGTLVILVV